MAFGSCNPSGILLCCNLCHAFFAACKLLLSVSNLSSRLSFLLSLLQTSRSLPPSHVFVLRLSSLQSTWLLQRSVTICFSSCFCVTPFHTSSVLCCCSTRNRFSTRKLSIPQLQSQLGVLLLYRHPSILALLQCDDDFQYPCLSSSIQLLSSRHCSPRTFQPAVGKTLDCLLLPMLFRFFEFSPAVGYVLLACNWLCSFASGHVFVTSVQLSETLVDLLLVVVQDLRLCAPFRQSASASFVDFFSTLALLAVVLSVLCLLASPPPALLCGNCCSEVRLRHLQRRFSVCAASWSLVRVKCSGSSAP